MLDTKQKAFTLVELIVVVTILAILATIGFVSYSKYLKGIRDTSRITQLSSISDGLNLYSTRNSLPLPEDNIEIQTNGEAIGYQGYAGSNILETIEFTKGGQDPTDDTYFSYFLTKDRSNFQLMAFLEKNDNLVLNKGFEGSKGIDGELTFIRNTHAVDYEVRYPKVAGEKLGILTDTDNTPVQELLDIATAGLLDITSTTTGYISYLTNEETLTDGGLLSINTKSSCKRIKQMEGSSSDGVYEVNPTGVDGAEFEVYCDMTTDGGGWTFFMHTDDTSPNGSYFETPAGSYQKNRDAIGSAYTLSSDIFAHTEMMITLDDADPIIAEESSKIVFYEYEQGYDGFNKGPSTCVGLTSGFLYKIKAQDEYTFGGTSSSCGANWYPKTVGNTQNLNLLYVSALGQNWGTGMGGDGSWYHYGWWYLR